MKLGRRKAVAVAESVEAKAEAVADEAGADRVAEAIAVGAAADMAEAADATGSAAKDARKGRARRASCVLNSPGRLRWIDATREAWRIQANLANGEGRIGLAYFH